MLGNTTDVIDAMIGRGGEQNNAHVKIFVS